MTLKITPPYAPYKNRWIAVVRGRVVGVGKTADRAYRAAKLSCPKDRLGLLFVDESGMATAQPPNFDPWFKNSLLKQIAKILHRQGQEAYLVGGAVRDGFLNDVRADSGDLDLIVPHSALRVARTLADELGAAYYPVDAERDVGRVVLSNHYHVDITSYRGNSLAEDLRNRDFTINAMALSLNPDAPRLIDPLNGQRDLQQKRLRAVSDDAIKTDPVRGVRGVRQSFEFGFTLTPETEDLIRANAAAIQQVSPERLRDEMMKLMQVNRPGGAIDALYRLGLLAHILPETLPMIGVEQSPPHYLPVFEHSLLVMNNWPALAPLDDLRLAPLAPLKAELTGYFQTQLTGNLSRASLMPLAALLHDIGKPATFKRAEDGRIRFFNHPQLGADIARQILNSWRFSGQATHFISSIVKHHMRPLLLAHQDGVSKRAIYRLIEAAGDAAPALADFSLLDHLATYPAGEGQIEWESLLGVVLKLCRTYFAPKLPALLTGKDIIQTLHIPPGPEIGRLLKKVKEAQAVGEISTKEEALALVSEQVSG
jgi:putative nucleotidyltransferase with HDIG domain